MSSVLESLIDVTHTSRSQASNTSRNRAHRPPGASDSPRSSTSKICCDADDIGRNLLYWTAPHAESLAAGPGPS